jgi:hypothetical protein
VGAPGPDAETILASANNSTGELQWFHCDLEASSLQPVLPGTSLGATPSDLPGGDAFIDIAALATPAVYRGMPSPRFWAFEDATANYGNVTAPVEDVTTSLVVEYVLRYANDHYVLPIPLLVGSLVRVDSLIVTDTYGEILVVRPITTIDGPSGPFRLFEHTLQPSPAATVTRDPLFVLLPTVADTLVGSPIEQVDYARDDTAEIVWAIENVALGPAGTPADRTAAAAAAATATPLPGPDPAVRIYLPRTAVPNNWFPFLQPLTTTATGVPSTVLNLADIPPLTGAMQVAPLPWGRIISEQASTSMPQEEITGAGVQVTRAWRYARWSDGRQLSWVHRVTSAGRGPAASGLSFDQAI